MHKIDQDKSIDKGFHFNLSELNIKGLVKSVRLWIAEKIGFGGNRV